ncbi:tetratricopeptide repeat protein [Chthoniobacter flavus]|nr:tetratricopeptide repeat protein [Chthoniobacter flavus]
MSAADYQGADAMLKKLAEQLQKSPDAEKPADPVAELRKKLVDFGKQASTLPPEQAAAQWLAMYDLYAALPAEALRSQYVTNYRDQLRTGSFFEQLPPGSAWDALITRLETRKTGDAWRDRGSQLLASVLRGDAAASSRVLKEIRAAMEDPKQAAERPMLDAQMLDMMEDSFEIAGGSDQWAAVFEKRLAQMEKAGPLYVGGSMITPPLVKAVGPEKAEALLRRALAIKARLVVNDEETHRLAVRLALQSIDQLPSPQWTLVRKVEDARLYEALAKRFPRSEPQDASDQARAATVYLASLVAENRIKEAAQFATDSRGILVNSVGGVNGSVMEEASRQSLSRPFNGLLRELLSSDPSLPYWHDYIQLSAQLGDSDKALALLREIVARPNLSLEIRGALRSHYVDALLAADQVEEGVKVLREKIQVEAKATNAAEKDLETQLKEMRSDGNRTLPSPLTVRSKYDDHYRVPLPDALEMDCLHLARLGHLLGQPELVEEGLAAAIANLAKVSDYQEGSSLEDIGLLMLQTGRGPQAEKFVSEFPVRPESGTSQLASLLGDRTEKLAVIYHLAGRHEDVFKLLEQSPYWGAGDLSGLDTNHFEVPLLFAAAKALAVTGKKEEALRVVKRLIESRGGYDPAYALFLELGGDGREAQLDAWARLDRFQERPLIWKAKLQLDAGRLDEAERTVRAAIAIDPSDGEEGKGDRMRAYAVLGDILEKKGDAAQAKIMRGAVEAIRLSENADDWWQAGLLQRAVKMYEEALEHFADAYCIQSRLALRYSELGDLARAEEHYRRAFELMPESFGRIESHCFGCEGTFSNQRAQDIAERVFTQLAAAPGARPQVFYLLGYLREEEGRYEEAVEQFRQAVQLDPDYFNAWKHLLDAAGRSEHAQADIEKATLALLRLDPAMKHDNVNFSGIRNLRVLWDAILAAEKARPVREFGPIFRLPQAALAMEQRQKAMIAMGQGETAGMNQEMPGPGKNLREEFHRNQALNGLDGLLELINRRP